MIIRSRKLPEIAELEYGEEKDSKDIKNMKALSFEFAALEKDILERDKSAKCNKFFNVMDVLSILFYNHLKAPHLLDFYCFWANILSNTLGAFSILKSCNEQCFYVIYSMRKLRR